MKAYRTTLGGLTSIVAAVSRSQAAYRTLRSAHEAGYTSLKYTDVRVQRAPLHDAWAEVDATGIPWNECYLPSPTR